MALGATAVWWFARGPRPAADKQQIGAAADPAAAAAAAERVARLPDPLAYVTARAGREDPAAIDEMIQAYGAWASRPEALEARRVIARSLLGHPNLKVGLDALLKAVHSDQTPRNADPMWADLVQGVASLWDAVTVSFGRDLVMIDTRAKPNDLLLESLANARPEKIGEEQQKLLSSDLIDLYTTAKPEQRPAIERALHAMAGRDVVEILGGRGLSEGSNHLEAAAKARADLEAGKKTYQRELEEIAREERAAKN